MKTTTKQARAGTPVFPKISARFELVGPELASQWLETMAPNRKLKEASVAMYANDMAMGNWALSPQGIAFDEHGECFDGQHRLRAVVRSGMTVALLVLRGFPESQEKCRTMDVVDCGAMRTLPDRLKLMGCYAGNPNLVCAIARQIALVVVGANSRAARRLSLATTLEIIGLWAEELGWVGPLLDTPAFRPGRNAGVATAWVLAAAVCPKRTREALGRFTSGAGLDAQSALLELRNALISGRTGESQQRVQLCLSALLCEWHKLPGNQIHKAANLSAADAFFRERQKERLEKVAELFQTKNEKVQP